MGTNTRALDQVLQVLPLVDHPLVGTLLRMITHAFDKGVSVHRRELVLGTNNGLLPALVLLLLMIVR